MRKVLGHGVIAADTAADVLNSILPAGEAGDMAPSAFTTTGHIGESIFGSHHEKSLVSHTRRSVAVYGWPARWPPRCHRSELTAGHVNLKDAWSPYKDLIGQVFLDVS